MRRQREKRASPRSGGRAVTRAEIAARLRAAGIEEHAEEAMRLFCRFSGKSRAYALAEPAADCTEPALLAALARREAREPLAYVLGEAAFFEECYRVSPDCLIPRPESELLVELACRLLPEGGRMADLCTGSGCLAISTLRHRPDCVADAYDISRGALALARENANRNGVSARLSFFECDLLAPHGWGDTPLAEAQQYDLILSNPPYVTTAEMAELSPEVRREPSLALHGGEDGLVFYRAFLAAFPHALKTGGAFLFEIGADEGDALRALGRTAGFSVRILPDLAGRDRMALLTAAD